MSHQQVAESILKKVDGTMDLEVTNQALSIRFTYFKNKSLNYI